MRIEMATGIDLKITQCGYDDESRLILSDNDSGYEFNYPIDDETLEQLNTNILYRKCRLILEIEDES